jgi:ABC-type Fe3+-hydroxamate transport system substrate-binding protein
MRRLRAALAAALLAVACGSPEGEPQSPSRATPRRLLPLAPSAAEIAYALGLGDRVVGVGDFVTWPPEWADKPRLGDLFHPQLERIAALHADLAILLPSEQTLRARLEALGVPVLVVPSETLADFEVAVRAVARRCGVEAAGESLLAGWRAALAPDPLPRPLAAVVVVGREPGRVADLVVAGPGTFLDELLARLGVANAFHDAPVRYPQVSAEQVVLRRPGAIVELQPLAIPETRIEALRRDWLPLAAVPAVASGCLPIVAGEHVLVPGPRLPSLYRELRSALAACLEPAAAAAP